jgi:hypothetical protein
MTATTAPTRKPRAARKPKAAPAPAPAPEVTAPAVEAAPATPKPEKAKKTPPAPHPCACSMDCSAVTKRTFAQGHDARHTTWQVAHAAADLGLVGQAEVAYAKLVKSTGGAILDILADRAADATRNGAADSLVLWAGAEHVNWAEIPATDPRFRRVVAFQVGSFLLGR